jgi:hypothetical protein
MKKVVRLTESDLVSIIKRIIKEEEDPKAPSFKSNLIGHGGKTTAPVDQKQITKQKLQREIEIQAEEVKKQLQNFLGAKIEKSNYGWRLYWEGRTIDVDRDNSGKITEKTPEYSLNFYNWDGSLDFFTYGPTYAKIYERVTGRELEKDEEGVGGPEYSNEIKFRGSELNAQKIVSLIKRLVTELKNYESKIKNKK